MNRTDLVIRCPNCGSVLLRPGQGSRHFFDVVVWSDGCAQHVRDPLKRCPMCKSAFWFSDAQTLGSLPYLAEMNSETWFAWLLDRLGGDEDGRAAAQRARRAAPKEWRNALKVERCELADWQAALARYGADLSREITARRWIWWNGNHHVRNGLAGRYEPNSDSAFRANLEVLLKLLPSMPAEQQDPVERGEILRELGRFDEAIDLLERIDGGPGSRARRVADWARAGEALVQQY